MTISEQHLISYDRMMVIIPLSSSPQSRPAVAGTSPLRNSQDAIRVTDQIRAVAKQEAGPAHRDALGVRFETVEEDIREVLELIPWHVRPDQTLYFDGHIAQLRIIIVIHGSLDPE